MTLVINFKWSNYFNHFGNSLLKSHNNFDFFDKKLVQSLIILDRKIWTDFILNHYFDKCFISQYLMILIYQNLPVYSLEILYFSPDLNLISVSMFFKINLNFIYLIVLNFLMILKCLLFYTLILYFSKIFYWIKIFKIILELINLK